MSFFVFGFKNDILRKDLKHTNYAKTTEHVKNKEEIFVTSNECVLYMTSWFP